MSDGRNEVVVVDIKIPFWSMVVLMVKWTLAASPAIVILVAIATVISAVFGGLFHWNMMGGRV